MGWANLAALAIVGVLSDWAPAAFVAVLGALPLAYAGFGLLELGYGVLAWTSWSVAGLLVGIFGVVSLKAAFKRPPKRD